jgi:hypothetical protein
MKASKYFIAVLAVVFVIGCANSAEASSRTYLGERNVSDRAEYDVFRIGPGQGAFNALQVKAQGAPVEIKRIRIFFSNGTTQTIERNILLGRNSWTGFANLNGSNRLVNKVVFYYEARSLGWESAELKLFGLR